MARICNRTTVNTNVITRTNMTTRTCINTRIKYPNTDTHINVRIGIRIRINIGIDHGSWFESFSFKPRAVVVVYRAKRQERESEGEWAPGRF